MIDIIVYLGIYIRRDKVEEIDMQSLVKYCPTLYLRKGCAQFFAPPHAWWDCKVASADHGLHSLVCYPTNISIIFKTMPEVVGFDKIGFASLASLLSISRGPQDVEVHDQGKGDFMNSENWSSESENDSVIAQELSASLSKDNLIKIFLDHIAETFSQEKSTPLQKRRHERRRAKARSNGAIHVTASGLVMHGGETTVYVAKNGIGDDAVKDTERMRNDEELARTLTVWIRIIASTMKSPAIDRDYMWTRLVAYYKQRLHIYASAIVESPSENDLATAFVEGSDGRPLARELYSLSVQYKTAMSSEALKK